jgi:RNA polymerase sigma-70 factor (ECF subfamily)
MPRLPATRHSLLARLSDPADVEAWSEFVEVYQVSIFRYARARGLQDADAWEVVQRVLIVVHQKIGDWQSADRPGAFRAWLLRTAHRVCLEAFREMARIGQAVGGTAGDDQMRNVVVQDNIESTIGDRQRWVFCYASEIVRREVEAKTWNAFRLTAVGGVAAQDAAARLGMKVGSVYTAKCRVLARIHELVQEFSWSEI